MSQNVAFIGCGKLGTPILRQLLNSRSSTHGFHVSIRSAESKARLQSVLPPNGQRVQVLVGETTRAIEAADIVILACKPTQYREILSSPGVGTALAGKTLVSILGGVTESDLRAVLRDVKCEILRALPNLAALVGESTTIISEVSNAEALEAVRQLFLQVGTVHVLPVEKIETAAVITASGPAFFATILESFSQALISKGFDEATAQALAAGSMRSCSSLAIAGHSPSYITKQVATVGGSTEKGLEVLEILNVGSSVDQAINAIFEAAKNLGKPTAKSTSSGVAQAKAEAIPTSMNAAVLKGVRQIVVESRPVPVILNPGDMIVKIKFAGLCGSDLHLYRGVEDCGSDYIMGHEFTGTVVQVGASVSKFEIGDDVVSPFTTSCGQCYYCENGLSARCASSMLYGTPSLGGGQAQYVRVPYADTTAVKAPPGVLQKNLILMADIFPTGFYAARNGFSSLSKAQINNSTVAVIGCGPVGLCAIAAAGTFNPKHLIAIDAIPSRLENAASLGAEPKNFKTDGDALFEHVRNVTGGKGADIILELVGNKSALQLAYDLVRPGGMISSIGVHSAEFPFTAAQGYDKNIRLQMGRCPVSTIFLEALSCLGKCQDKLGFLTETIVPLSDSKEWYEKFERMEVQKVIFDAES